MTFPFFLFLSALFFSISAFKRHMNLKFSILNRAIRIADASAFIHVYEFPFLTTPKVQNAVTVVTDTRIELFGNYEKIVSKSALLR